MKVPFLDLKAQHDPIRDEINAAISQVVDSCAFAGGPFVEQFENEFASFCRSRFALGVGSGTEALWLALAALGVGPGDEVITVPNTFIATAEAISFCGATPVFVDIDSVTYTMDPALLSAAITPRTRAVIPVHLYGQMADMDPIMTIARENGLFVVEDACQAHGAEYKGRLAGSIGDAGCFSFYPGKNLGAFGEAGAVVTDHEDVAEKIRALRDHGQVQKYYHNHIGWNGRMDGIQGAVLSVKLKYLSDWNALRGRHATAYNAHFAGSEGIQAPLSADYGTHVYHVYSLRVQNREALMAHLGEKGVSCGIHYPCPVHRQHAYGGLGLGAGSFPAAEKAAREIVSLPMFPTMSPEQVDYVATETKRFAALHNSEGYSHEGRPWVQ